MKLNSLLALLCAGVGLCPAFAGPREITSQLPLHFEPAADGRYVARSDGYRIAVTGDAARIHTANDTVAIRWIGARTDALLEPEQELAGRSHYLLGADGARWRTDVPHYGAVRVHGLYDGVDALYYGRDRELEFDLVVSPGADPGQIAFRVDGAPRLEVDAGGDLVVGLSEGELRQMRPFCYQDIGGVRREVDGGYRLAASGKVRFTVGEYNRDEPLVIDPVIVYATYVGGNRLDSVNALAVDALGNVYVTGESQSPDFPANAYQSLPASGNPPGDVFVTKINAEGTAVLWSAYFGGSRKDYGNDIAVGVDGAVYVAGYTESADFPVANAAQPNLADDDDDKVWGDAFAVRLGPGGNLLTYSTYFGGNQRDVGTSVAIGPEGDIYLSGYTESDDLDVSDGAFQEDKNGRLGYDGFVARLRTAGPEVVFVTYLGGGNNDEIRDMAVDSEGQAYLTGGTLSADFPVAGGGFQSTYQGDDLFLWADGFVTKMWPNGEGLVFSTYLGGSRNDEANGIAIDSFTHIYVTGETNSTDFPVAGGIGQTVNGDGGSSSDAFVTKLDRLGGSLQWSFYFGGTGADIARSVAVTPSGAVAVGGESDSPNLPTTGAECVLRMQQGGRDAFAARFSVTGAPLWAAYVGGSAADHGRGIVIGPAGDLFLGGASTSADLPVSAEAARTVAQSGEGFVARISDAVSEAGSCISPPGIVNAASYRNTPVAPGEIINVFGVGLGPAALTMGQVTDGKFDTEVAGVKLLFDDVPSPLIYVVQTAIAGVVPYSVAGQEVTNVRVEYNGQVTNTVSFPVGATAPGIISLDSSGQGQGAVLHADYSVNGPANPVAPGGVVILFTTGEGQTDPPGVDGLLALSTYPKPLAPVSVRIGGIDAVVQYYGAAPGLVAGVMQVNVYVPENVEPGDAVPVVLRVGDQVSQPGITIAVR